ncbi:MAG TPA: thiamine pyrophosphate-binding protein [Bryobacteraceae bacterium]|jgi:thiamine pyrophosphate-dependent acetolactate synthase large subunit-like protein|nr:thiamine pyrophosphate-binding protein [Bryobacteraceae bacterium]
MPKSKNPVGRRGFLKGAAAGAAALVASPGAVKAQDAQTRGAATPLPSARLAAAESSSPAARVDVYTTDRPGSDFMADVIKSLGFEYVCANPGSSFRGLHESLVNYGKNKMPELLTCCHEESSVAMAHGYAKIEGKPLMIMAHGTVGLQHASMAIYNAFADRVPVFIILGNIADEQWRRGDVEWAHSVQDAAAMVRDYTKYDDAPVSLGHFAESAMRAYKAMMTPPMEPVVLVADAVLQEEPMSEADRRTARIPRVTMPTPPAGDSGAVAEAARMLVAAEDPVIIAGRVARTPAGLKLMIELAELLQAPVQDRRFRMNFPSAHPLYNGGNVATADLIMGLEIPNFWDVTHTQTPINRMGMESRSIIKPGAKLITIYSGDLTEKSNYQDLGRYAEVDLAIAADAEATLPYLIEACKKLITADRRRAFAERGAKYAEAAKKTRELALEQAAFGWDASPISTARVSAEIWNQIKNEDWSLLSDVNPFFSNWPTRLWNFEKHHNYIGGHGAYGVGYGAPAATGAALANRKYGRISVNIQCDGDLNYAPAVLWTSAHHHIPLLSIMHNNRAYHQELMYLEDMAARANRGVDTALIGTGLNDPNIDYATLAKAYGVYSAGPISNPNDLGPAIRKAIEVVKKGEPALIDVITQPR